jgi:hypothetical protein
MRLTRKLATLGAMAVILSGVTAPSAPAAGAGGALVVGDSLEVLTSPYLERYLPGVPLTVNAEGGYNSYQIFDLFGESFEPAHSVIVFDAGTNDNPAYPQILAENLTAVAGIVGDRCMVVPTIHGFTVAGVDNAGKNRVVAEFAASRPGTQTPDWARVATTRPDLMQPDGLHPTPEGAAYRAQLIARGVQRCLAFLSGSATGEEPALESRPEMQSVGRLAERQAEVTRAIAIALAREVGALVAPEPAAAAGVLAIISMGGRDA